MAKRYTFRLEPLLRLRQQREDERKRVVASRLREIATLRRRQELFELQIERQTESMRGSLTTESTNVDALRMCRHWLVGLRRGVLETAAQVSAQRAILAQERATLAEARKETKILDRLKARQREAYMVKLARAEQAELDDMNVTRFAHAATVDWE